MREIRAVLTERLRRTDVAESFRLKPEEKIDFLPGQFLQVIFDERDRSNTSLNKFLSFSCGPNKGHIEVTKKLSDSEFSSHLKALKQGDNILLKAPMGKCVFKEEYGKIGFLIGGIGITPVISMLEHIAIEALPTDACLLYSNWTEEDIAFRAELDAWSDADNNINVVHTVASSEPEDKKIHFGLIDKEFLLNNMFEYEKRVIFIFGPPKMVAAMNDLCVEVGCPKELIKTEIFVGY